MRTSLLALFGLLLMALGAQAQPANSQAAPAAPLDPVNNPLDAMLLRWEGSMKKVETLKARVVQEREDNVLRTRVIYDGEALYMRPNLFSLELRRRDKPAVFQKYVCTGTFLYEYNPLKSEIRAHEISPPQPGKPADDNILSFLFEVKAAEAKTRYGLKLLNPDQNYVYVEVLPLRPADRQDFQKAYLALTQTTLMPRAIKMVEPNGNQLTFDFPVIDVGVRLDRAQFSQPQLPPGWKMVRVPPGDRAPAGTPQPRLYRPNQ
jgi:TIGR03009 family protein